MEGLRQYIYAIVCAALMSGIALSLVQSQGAKALLKLLCGAILAMTVMGPLSGLDFRDADFFPDMPDVEACVREGENLSRDALAQHIKQACEAYILDKATSLSAEVCVRISVTGSPPVPGAAELSGRVSPEVRDRLEAILQKDLGIPKENVQWIG